MNFWKIGEVACGILGLVCGFFSAKQEQAKVVEDLKKDADFIAQVKKGI